MDGVDIRESSDSETAEIERLYAAAFPEEDLRPLVRNLLKDTPGVRSLVAAGRSGLFGHIVFTPCRVTGADAAVALLGPLAVDAVWRQRGVGGALVRTGLDRLRQAGVGRVLVLGDPAYYGRFGFEREDALAPPFALPTAWRDAWQSTGLTDDALPHDGRLIVPPAWNDPKLWAP
jgi:putative acetyltransferase